MCVLEREVKGGGHYYEGGDEESEGACEHRSEELLFEFASLSASLRGEGTDNTD